MTTVQLYRKSCGYWVEEQVRLILQSACSSIRYVGLSAGWNLYQK